MEAVGALVLDLDAQALAQRRVAQPLDRRLAAADVHPARQERVQVRGAGEVRIRVERDLDPVVPRAVDHREQLRRRPLLIA